MTLEEVVGEYKYRNYTGSHTGFTIVCTGVTKPAAEVFDRPDTVMVVRPGKITGEAHVNLCIGLQGCPGDTWYFMLHGSGITMRFSEPSAEGSDGLFHWWESPGDFRVSGSHSAVR